MAESSPRLPQREPLPAGTWYLLPTPFRADGELDLDSQRRIVEAAIGWGVDGLTVMGVMSEPTSLTDAERTSALRAIFDAAAGRVPVVVGCSSQARSLTLERMREARELGAAAAMVASPTLLRNVDLLPDWFVALQAEADLPILLQDEPAATGVTIPVSVLVACVMAKGGPRSIKVEDPPTPAKIGRLNAAVPGLALFGGLGGIAAYSELRRGAAGTMTGFALPEVMRALRLAAGDGRWEEAARLFDRFLPLIAFEAQAVVGLLIRKEMLRRRGAIATADTRGLVRRIDETTLAELDDVLDRVGVVPSIERFDPLTSPQGSRGREREVLAR